ncbi:unnamed protein product, partial [Adineta steineri]
MNFFSRRADQCRNEMLSLMECNCILLGIVCTLSLSDEASV